MVKTEKDLRDRWTVLTTALCLDGSGEERDPWTSASPIEGRILFLLVLLWAPLGVAFVNVSLPRGARARYSPVDSR